MNFKAKFQNVVEEFQVLKAMALAAGEGDNHRDRIENFYRAQASHYDRFRRRLLRGRDLLWRQVELPENGIWIDVGAGTGLNLEAVGRERAQRCQKIVLVDLSPSLLLQAEARVREMGLKNVELREADARHFDIGERCDLISFTYSLTMIPDWFVAIDHALSLLNDRGQVAVLDFFVSRKYDSDVVHSWGTRSLLPLWFAHDNVFLNPDHLPYLRSKTETLFEQSQVGRLPYLPVNAPYYIYLGQRPTT